MLALNYIETAYLRLQMAAKSDSFMELTEQQRTSVFYAKGILELVLKDLYDSSTLTKVN